MKQNNGNNKRNAHYEFWILNFKNIFKSINYHYFLIHNYSSIGISHKTTVNQINSFAWQCITPLLSLWFLYKSAFV